MIKYFNVFQGRLILFSLFIAIISLNLFNCNKLKNDIPILINLDKSNSLFITKLFSEINFVALESKNNNLGIIPDRVKIVNDQIFYLYNGGSTSILTIHTLDGKLVNEVIRNTEDIYPIYSISDFGVYQDTLFILNSEKIARFSISNWNRIIPDLNMPEYYSAMEIKFGSLYCFSQILSPCVKNISLEGFINSEYISMDSIPMVKPDRFPHFTNTFDNEKLYFYHRYQPNVYEISPDNVLLKYKFQLGEYNLSSDDKFKIINGGKDQNKISNMFCNDLGMFCSFYSLNDFKNLLIFSFKVNKTSYYTWFNKNTNKSITYNKVQNDSGFPFLTNPFNAIEIVGSYNDKIIFLIEPDQINIENKISPNIKSNWNLVKDSIDSNSGPILAFLTLRE